MRRIVYLTPKAFNRKLMDFIGNYTPLYMPIYEPLANKGIPHFVTRKAVYARRYEKGGKIATFNAKGSRKNAPMCRSRTH